MILKPLACMRLSAAGLVPSAEPARPGLAR